MKAAGESGINYSRCFLNYRKKVLDLGCGYGWHCKYAAQMGASEILGIDSSEKMIAKAVVDNSEAQIKYEVCGIEEYSYPENSYDFGCF